MKIFGYEPAIVVGALVSVINLIGTFGISYFNPDNAAAIVVIVNALAAILMAWTTRPVAPSLFTSLVSAVLALGATYGLQLPAETVLAINATVYPILMLIARGQVSPVDTAVSRLSRTPNVEAAEYTAKRALRPAA